MQRPAWGVDATLALFLLLLLLGAAGACGDGPAGAATVASFGSGDGGVDAAPTAVGTAAHATVVRRGDFRGSVMLTGEIAAVSRTPVHVPPAPEYEITLRWIIEDGAAVREGDRVAELDTSQIASQLSDKEEALQAAINELASKQADVAGKVAERELALEQARVALEKAEIEASVPRDLLSLRDHESRRLALEQARVAHAKAAAELEGYRESSRAELDVLRVDLETARREVQDAERAIETMVLRAPRDGIAVVAENFREDRKFQEGDTAWVGAELLSIPDLTEMMVEAVLSDVDDGKIAPGMDAVCILDTYPDRRIPGVIRAVSPVAQSRGYRSMQRQFSVRVDLAESDPETMLPGMSARLEVETARREDVLLVPRAALSFGDDRVSVTTAGGGIEPVSLGPCNPFECVLLEGPPEGTPLRRIR